MLIVTIFIVTPLASTALIGSQIMLCFLAALSITGVAAVSGSRIVSIIVLLLAIAGIALDWTAHYGHQPQLQIFDNIVRIAFVLMLAVIVTSKVFRSGNVTHHRIQGAICVYLLAGLAWSYAFDLVWALDPGAFRLAEALSTNAARTGFLRYFSFVTLTTLGYGDILPLTPAARSLATSEALFGQLYPTVMIARLVSLELLGRAQSQGPS